MELTGEMNPARRDQHEEKLTRDRFRRRQPAADICAVHRAGHPEPVDAGPEEHRSGEEDQEYLEAQHQKDQRKEDWHQHHQVLRGISLPILVRFAGILEHRLGELAGAFQTAIAEHRYQGEYCCVYPIKVNQQRQVVEEVLEFGRPLKFGLEAGSKPELMAVMAMADNETPIVCNGFKDDEYIEMAMLAQKLGRHIIPVVEKYTELKLILRYSERVGVRPMIGLRVKLASRGSGRWRSSGGYRSKFGLSVSEAVRMLQELKDAGMADCLNLLHFHLGSQITNIRQIKAAVNEAVRVYVDLYRAGAGLKYLDVGGGLGIDYDGSQTDFESSVN